MLSVMDINIDVRRKQVENLNQFIAESRKRFDEILGKLGWCEEKLSKNLDMVLCKEDTNHLIPLTAVEEHTEKCLINKLGYSPNDEFLSLPLNDSVASIIIDDTKKREIFTAAQKTDPNFTPGWTGHGTHPMTVDRYTSTYSTDERLVMYNYARQHTKGPEAPPEFNVTQVAQTSENQKLTYEERLEQQRNAKRRPIKYKAVHTKRKNHTEVLRDVIENQMEAYEDWVIERDGGGSEAEKWSKKHGLDIDVGGKRRNEYEENYTSSSYSDYGAASSSARHNNSSIQRDYISNRYKRTKYEDDRQNQYGSSSRTEYDTHSIVSEDCRQLDVRNDYEYRESKRLKSDFEENGRCKANIDRSETKYKNKNDNRKNRDRTSKYEHRKPMYETRNSSIYENTSSSVHTRCDEYDSAKISRLEEYDSARSSRLEENGSNRRSSNKRDSYRKRSTSRQADGRRTYREENGAKSREFNRSRKTSDSNLYRERESNAKYRYSKRYEFDDSKPDIAIIERLREVDQSRKALLAEQTS